MTKTMMSWGLTVFMAGVLVMSSGFLGTVSADRSSRASLELIDGGYRNLLIAISDRVPDTPELIDRIKTVFTETSRFMYQATK